MFHVEHKFLRFHYWRELLGKNGAKATALQTLARGTWLRNEDRAYVVTRPALPFPSPDAELGDGAGAARQSYQKKTG